MTFFHNATRPHFLGWRVDKSIEQGETLMVHTGRLVSSFHTNFNNNYNDPDKATFGDLGSEAYVAVWILTRERWSVSSSKEYTSELEKVTKAFAAKVKQVEKLTVKVRDPKNPTKAPVSVSQKACPTDKVQRTKWFKDVMALLNQPRFFLMSLMMALASVCLRCRCRASR